MFSRDNSILLQELNLQLITKLYKRSLGVNIKNNFKNIDNPDIRELLEGGIRYFYPLIAGNEYFYEQYDFMAGTIKNIKANIISYHNLLKTRKC